MTEGEGTGPRILLRRLREIMAAGGSAEARLNEVTRAIAANLVAEVCSVYLRRAGEILELFATHGLRREAVHATRLRFGEGLVGDIAAHARPLSLADAQDHPHFAYRPETGEEAFHSFLGVPVLRAGSVVGVLAVQNRSPRAYAEDEVEALQTIAMVLAELVTSGQLVAADELLETEGNVTLPQRLEGTPLSDGLAHGDAVIHDPPVEVHALIADDPERETQRLEQALLDLSAAIDGMLAGLAARGGVEDRAILETYRMFAQDRGWRERIGEAIRGGLTADAAVQRVQLETRARMAQMREPFFRERLHDFEDLSNRLLRHLAGRGGLDPKNLPENAVLVARSLGPAELLDYDAANLKAVLLEEGSQTEHSVVVARSLGVPMIGRLGESIKKVRAGDPVIVDGRHGVAFLRPAEDVFAQYDENLAARNERRAEYVAQRSEAAITRDGVRIRLDMNAGLLLDMPHLEDSGAEGIGLFRTELQFMVQPEFPDVRTQIEIYSRILDEAGDKPVLFRTLDIGGDKILPYQDGPLEREENPAMGWRAIRVGLDRPALLRTQLRALLYAASGRHLGVMFPMVAEVPELRAARRILDLEIERLARRNVAPPARLEVGIMLEVPALFWQLENLLPLVDFVSIGSNDLIQFLFAADRSSPRLSERYDVMAPGFLRLLRTLVEACGEAGVQVSLCGEMAGRPLDAMALVGVGLRALSVAPSAVGAVKRMIRSLDCGQLTAYMNRLYDAGDHSIRDNLKNFAQDHHFLV